MSAGNLCLSHPLKLIIMILMFELTQLIRKIQLLAETSKRIVVAVVGPPAAGKSTFVDELLHQLDGAVIVPMDGFHLDNIILKSRGLMPRKGSPETFDASGYADLLRRMRHSTETVYAPVFDREADLSRASAIEVPAETKIILAEGNYLLLDQPEWKQFHSLFDLTIALDVPMEILQQRLVKRWLDYGLTADEALVRAESNDLPNARLVIEHSIAAECAITNY